MLTMCNFCKHEMFLLCFFFNFDFVLYHLLHVLTIVAGVLSRFTKGGGGGGGGGRVVSVWKSSANTGF